VSASLIQWCTRLALATLAVIIALSASAACTSPPQLSVNYSVDKTNPDVWMAVAEITHSAGLLQSSWNGSGYFQFPQSVGAGTQTHRVAMTCMSRAYEFKVTLDPGGDCQPATSSSTFGPAPTAPQFTERIHIIGDHTSTTIFWNFPNTAMHTNYVWATRFFGDGRPSKVILAAQSSDKGASTLENTSGPGYVIVEGKSCVDQRGSHQVTLSGSMSCPTPGADESCKSCFGAPIHAVSGNMRATDEDPIAGFGEILPFKRFYDSYSRLEESTLLPVRRGAFGAGWGSIFSASAIGMTTPLGTEFVNVLTEENAQYVFRRTSPTSFTQVFPDRPAAVTRLSQAADGSWTHADPAKSFVRVFAADGRPTAFRDRATGREIKLTWTNDRPSRVEDSWGAWALLITTNTAGYITKITAEDDPASSWTYTYHFEAGHQDGWPTERHFLIRVDSPAGKWRSYNHWYRLLSEIRDGAGRLLESHAYREDRTPVTSIQQTDDITSIYQDRVGRVEGEYTTYVTYKTGRMAAYYSRSVAGMRRVVEIDGGCTSCGAESAVMTYDAAGNVIRKQSADGYITMRTYDAARLNVVQEMTALRPVACDPAQSATRCKQTPDELPVVNLVPTAATVTTTYTYGDSYWPMRPTLIETSSVLNPGSTRKTAIAYDAVSGRTLLRSTTGWTAIPAREETHTTATTLYDGVAVAEFNPGGTFEAAWLALPQPRGLQRKIDGPRAGADDAVSFVYYPNAASVAARNRGRLAAVRNAAGHVTRYEDYDVRGNARRVTDANGVTETRAYDSLGQLTSSTMPGTPGCDTAADPLCATTLASSRTYHFSGPLLTETDAGGAVRAYEYDDRRRVTAISRGPAATDLRERMETVYDPNTGRRSAEVAYARENNGWVEKRRTSYTYDVFGRVSTVAHPDGTSAGYTYDAEGRVRSVRDENHAEANTFYSYDAAGRLSEVRQTLATAPGGFAVTQYGYDAHGDLTSVTDPNGNITTYEYDDFGQMLRQLSPVTGTTSYVYDISGNLAAMTDANGAATTRTYDILDRVLSAVSIKPGAVTETVSWTYDDATAGRHGIGRATAMTDPAGTTTYAYERRGLLRREERTFAGTSAPYVTRFTWSADAERTSITYPSGAAVQYQYDYAGRPISASAGATALVTSAQYLPFGPATSIVYGNGTTKTMQYDARYRRTKNALSGPGGTIAEYNLTWDAAGNVTGIADATDAGYSRTFAYDDLNRLTTANTGLALWRTASWTYDTMGNVLAARLGDEITGDESINVLARKTFFTYQGTTPKIATVRNNDLPPDTGDFLRQRDRRLRAAANETGYRTMTYDAAGNELTWVATRTWSARNHLQSVRDEAETPADAHVVEYGYDGRGVRVTRAERQANGTSATRYFFYSPELQLLASTNDSGPNVWASRLRTNSVPSVKHEFVWFAGEPLAQISGSYTDGPHWYFNDHLGTPLLQTNAAATAVWRVEYEPWGDIWQRRVPAPVEEGPDPVVDQPLRFPGQEAAMTWEGTEERYNIFRWYRSGWGRYTQADPIGIRGDINIFRYAAANPAAFTDRLGLFCTKDFVAHYFTGGGTAIDLAAVGLLSQYTGSASVTGVMDSERSAMYQTAKHKAKAFCAGCPTGTKTESFTSSDDSVYANPYDQGDCLFSLGSTQLAVTSKCSVTTNCSNKSFNYTCGSAWKLRDWFTDPLSLKETMNLPFEPGTPYQINADWSDYHGGSGSW